MLLALILLLTEGGQVFNILMNFGIIIQARINSKRLPGKVLKKHKNITPLKIIIDKLKLFNYLKQTIVATTQNNEDKKIVNFCKKNKIKYFRGSSNDVMMRFYKCSKKFNIKNIIRITADCPFIDMFLLKKMINIFKNKKIDYLANTYPLPTNFPDGSDIEIFKTKSLKECIKNDFLPSEREHVTISFWKKKKFKSKKINLKKNYSKFRYTIDNPNDFEIYKSIIDKFRYEKILTLKMSEIINFLSKNKKLILYQKKIKRNYGWKSSLLKDKHFLKFNR